MANTHSIDLELSSSQYLSIVDGDQSGLDLSTDFTIEAWIKLEQLPGTVVKEFGIVSKYDGVTSDMSYAIELHRDNKIWAYFKDASANVTTGISNAAFSAGDVGEWIHLAIVFDISVPSITMYKNGSLFASGLTGSAATSIKNSAVPFCIGAYAGAAGISPNYFFDGLIDEVRIWSDIRTAQEISDNYQQELVGNEANLVGYWNLNNSLLDETSNNNDLINNNSAVFSNDIPFIGTVTSIFTGNTNLKKEYDFTGDANLKGAESITFTGNFNLKKENISDNFLADSIIVVTIIDTFISDANLKGVKLNSFTGDTNLKSIESTSFTSDTIIMTLYMVTFTGNVNLVKTEITIITGDANLKSIESDSFTSNANLKSIESDSFTGNANLKDTESTSFTANANLKKVYNFTGDANLKDTESTSFVSNANLKDIELNTFTSNGNLKKIISNSFTGDTSLKSIESTTFTGNSNLKKENVLNSFLSDSILVTKVLNSFTSDANLKSVESTTFTSDAHLKKINLSNFAGLITLDNKQQSYGFGFSGGTEFPLR